MRTIFLITYAWSLNSLMRDLFEISKNSEASIEKNIASVLHSSIFVVRILLLVRASCTVIKIEKIRSEF